ncbi:Succinate-semialdehyde dehydrogenase (acetylating) protein [Dioscorea alata]|uniref:Succinate-semialdehyde dehydrogenase (Acetylating) protein n=1 Tax=Dioscorea alata TaxID=55571 RepID=A0ACB7URV0_DIOAL|nr:Succinate-semialdehyde dehydrogenase (acetylating) protein [Dioscorea alata]
MAFFSSTSRAILRRLSSNRYVLTPARALSSSAVDTSGYHVSGGPSFMRGTVFWEPNKPLTIEEFHMPQPKSGEVLIKTKACGVCHSDLHVMKGELPFSSPCVVGHEITGEVVEHGVHTDSGIVKRFPIGSHVVGAFIMPCGNCFFCVKGQEDLCEAFFAYNRARGTLYDGETRLFLRSNGKPVYMYSMGGLAEYCVVPANALAVLPNSLPYSESAILGCAVFTAYGAMRHAAELRAGDSVAVIGVGGVGSSCLQIARAFGASEIIAVDVLDEKLHSAKLLGATHTINAMKEDVVDQIKEITGGMGVDVAIEALGKASTFAQCTKSVRDGGKAVIIGLAATNVVGEVDITRLVRRQVKIIGSYGARARQDLPQVVKLAEAGTFDLQNTVSRKCQFEEANQAFEDLNHGKIVGRAVVEIM